MLRNIEFFLVPTLKIENNLLFHVINIVLRVSNLVLDLTKLFICVSIIALKIFHLSKQSQLLFINHDLIIASTIIIEPEIFSSSISSSLFLLFMA
jgi:hypothetical protein